MNVSIALPHPKYLALSLSPLMMDDASEMVIHLNDEKTIKYLIGPPYPLSTEHAKNYISSRPSVNGHCLALAIRDHGRLIGEVGLDLNTTPRTYELGYYLSRPYWNNGIVSIAVKTYLDVMIKKISAGEDITIEAGYLVDNFASGRVLKKCGFIETERNVMTKNEQKLQGVRLVRIIPGEKQVTDLDDSCN